LSCDHVLAKAIADDLHEALSMRRDDVSISRHEVSVKTGSVAMAKRTAPPKPPRRRRAPRVNRRAIEKAETRRRILKAAAAIAGTEGLHAASIPRVMREAGLTIGGFYGHFASKIAMDAEIIRTVFGPYSAGVLARLNDHAGMDWFEKAINGYLSSINRDHPLGCPYPSVISAVSIGMPEVKQAFTEAMKQRIAVFEAHAPQLPGVTSRQRAVAATALTIGGLLLARATSGDPLSDEILEACRKWALPERDLPEPTRKRR
jgi:TetR/AcrR family transcriptional repressor of nem operon